MTGPLWISEQDVVSLLSLPQAIDALRDGLREEAAGHATNMIKTHVLWGSGATLHAIGAVFDRAGIAGAKTWAHTPGGAMPLLILIDANDGSVLAIVEAFALGQMRTGGISGLATDLMARQDARRMAMIGTGKQSLAQIAAVAAVRSLDRVTIWSPTPGKREALAKEVGKTLELDAIATDTLEEALEGADVVTLATRAKTPFLSQAALDPGTHLNAVGAITPERAEFASALLSRASRISADSIPQVRKLSREFIDAFGDDEAEWARVSPLSALVADRPDRHAGDDLTVFKAMGMGISDLALGATVLRLAERAGLGRRLTRPERAPIRLRDTAHPSEIDQ